MFVAESTQGRRIICRLEPGEDLQTSLLRLCAARGVRSGTVQVRGEVDALALDAPGGAGPIAGPLVIASLDGALAEAEGELSLEFAGVFVDPAGRIVAGRVARARVVRVELVITTFDDLVLRRDGGESAASSANPPTAIAAAKARLVETLAAPRETPAAPVAPNVPIVKTAPIQLPAPAAAPPEAEPPRRSPAPGSEPSWADVAAHSAMREREQDDDRRSRSVGQGAPDRPLVARPGDDLPPEAPLRGGDLLDHSRFGRCEVLRVEGDHEYAQIRLKNGRQVRLALDVLQLSRSGSDDTGRRIFRGTVET